MNTMEETRKFLESIGQPGGDLYSLPTSEKRFDDGCQYRFEVRVPPLCVHYWRKWSALASTFTA